MKSIKSIFYILTLNLAIFSQASYGSHEDLNEILGESFLERKAWGMYKRDYTTLIKKNKITKEDTKQVITLHHTVLGDSLGGYYSFFQYYLNEIKRILSGKNQAIEDEFEIAKKIENLHISKFKWADIGFHFMIGPSGKVYEGRPIDFKGSHTGGLNTENIGIAFIGCYDEEGCKEENYQISKVTKPMINNAIKLRDYLAKEYNFKVSPETVWPRSEYDLAKKSMTRFPYSPGNLIIGEEGLYNTLRKQGEL